MRDLDEYLLKIDAYTPSTIPMARLAEYMSMLSQLLGNQERVHFERLDEGSTVLVSRVEEVARPKVAKRLATIEMDDAPPEAKRAITQINEMLRDDNARGTLFRGEAKILPFPGRDIPKPERIGPFNQEGSIDGVLIRIGGKDKSAHATLIDSDGNEWKCEVDREMARDMARELFGTPLRIFGTGRWTREEDEQWKLVSFRAARFDLLEDGSLAEAVEKLRAIKGSAWETENDPLALLKEIRDGKDGTH